MPTTLMREAERLGGPPVKRFVQVLLWFAMSAAVWGLRARRAGGKGRAGACLGVAAFAVIAILAVVPTLALGTVAALLALPAAAFADRLRPHSEVTP